MDVAPGRRTVNSHLVWQILREWQTKLTWPQLCWQGRGEWDEKRGGDERNRRGPHLPPTKSRAGYLGLSSPARELSSYHLRGTQPRPADENQQLCDDHDAQTSSLLMGQVDEVVPSLRDGQLLNVFCHRRVWTADCGKKCFIADWIFLCGSAAPAAWAGGRKVAEVGVQRQPEASPPTASAPAGGCFTRTSGMRGLWGRLPGRPAHLQLSSFMASPLGSLCVPSTVQVPCVSHIASPSRQPVTKPVDDSRFTNEGTDPAQSGDWPRVTLVSKWLGHVLILSRELLGSTLHAGPCMRGRRRWGSSVTGRFLRVKATSMGCMLRSQPVLSIFNTFLTCCNTCGTWILLLSLQVGKLSLGGKKLARVYKLIRAGAEIKTQSVWLQGPGSQLRQCPASALYQLPWVFGLSLPICEMGIISITISKDWHEGETEKGLWRWPTNYALGISARSVLQTFSRFAPELFQILI